MSTASMSTSSSGRYELRFHSLYKPGRGYSFPCDANGLVDIDALRDDERDSYLFARALIGRELSLPGVQLSDH